MPAEPHLPPQPIPMLSVVGKSGSGKTTLLEKLIPALRDLDLRLAAIKHDAHSFEIDQPGKDSWRLKQAGSEAIIISSAEKLAIVQDTSVDLPPRLLQERYLHGVDLILTEGYRAEDLPKIEVHRRARSSDLLCGPEDNLIAVVTDEALQVAVPCFNFDEIGPLALFLRDYVRRRQQSTPPREALELYLDGVRLPLNPFMQQLVTDLMGAVLKNLKQASYHSTLQLILRAGPYPD
ncbi:MAG: molybdopterin-guanine dinucleotide biosynthesis protein B [Candidatus Tectomicrobia bacterium]|nr:molybdopterin-guanine dinucleotide biosynthesis protein B [Candidatus Tectomicrobia bacterium]